MRRTMNKDMLQGWSEQLTPGRLRISERMRTAYHAVQPVIADLPTKRACPHCGHHTLRLWKLLLSNTPCSQCHAFVGPRSFFDLVYFFASFLLWVLSGIALINAFGVIAALPLALFWLVFELFRELIVPLEVKQTRLND